MDYFITTLNLRPDLYTSLISQINHHFKYISPESFQNDFYPLVQKENWHNCYVLIDKNNKNLLLGHIGVKYKKLFFKQDECNMAMLGGIFINENFQGKGLFHFLFDHVLKNLSSDTVTLFLWSDLTELYTKKGFFLGGGINTYKMKKKDGISTKKVLYTKTKLENLTEKQLHECQSLYKNTSSRWITFKRELSDWDSLLKIPSIDCFLGTNESNSVIYYFLKNKGNDLQHIVHEYAYLPSYKTDLIMAIEDTNSLLWVPEGDSLCKEMPPSLDLEEKESISLGFIKILKQDLLFSFLQKIINPVITIYPHQNEENIRFEYNGKEYESTVQEFLLNLWGPYRYTEWDILFPPLFIAGGESI